MREILFRGKLKDGRWAYGNLEVKKDGVCIITPDETPLGSYGQVDPETIGQYIGLIDANEKRIFEGDIVLPVYGGERLHDPDMVRYLAVVKYGALNCSCCDGVYGWEFENGDIRDAGDYAVVGNIHDSPDLIGGAEK